MKCQKAAVVLCGAAFGVLAGILLENDAGAWPYAIAFFGHVP
jgi:hypothetical protein